MRARALRARGTPEFAGLFRSFTEARGRFGASLAPDDARYLEFRLWKEGVACYTKYRVAVEAERSFRPSAAYRAQEDYTDFGAEAGNVLTGIVAELASMKLVDMERVALHSAGAANALLLDAARPGWGRHYTTGRLSLDGFFGDAR